MINHDEKIFFINLDDKILLELGDMASVKDWSYLVKDWKPFKAIIIKGHESHDLIKMKWSDVFKSMVFHNINSYWDFKVQIDLVLPKEVCNIYNCFSKHRDGGKNIKGIERNFIINLDKYLLFMECEGEYIPVGGHVIDWRPFGSIVRLSNRNEFEEVRLIRDVDGECRFYNPKLPLTNGQPTIIALTVLSETLLKIIDNENFTDPLEKEIKELNDILKTVDVKIAELESKVRSIIS